MNRQQRWGFVVVLAALLLGLAPAPVFGPAPAFGNELQESMYVIDGDTVGVGEQHFRLLKINAPEVSKARCQNELNQGLAAKERVEALIANAQNVEMTGKGYTDKYKRGLINLFVDGEDVGEILIREGLALKWRSGAAAKERYRRYWCG